MNELRLFVAIDIDEAGKGALGRLIERLGRAGGAVCWVGPSQMHLTLNFLGPTPAERIYEIAGAMTRAAGGVEPFEFALAGVGAFPSPDRAKVVWVGVEEPTGSLARLHRGLTDGLAELGYRPEQRAFHPHVTVGRVRKPGQSAGLASAIGKHGEFAGPEQLAEQVVLYSSQLMPGGPQYDVLAHAMLGEAGEGGAK